MAVDLPGELRELAGQVVGDDPLRRNAPVQLSDPLDFVRREAGQVPCIFSIGDPLWNDSKGQELLLRQQ
jgi:hypothetical protein